MAASWKTIPLFISSTFRDMHAERDELNSVVFPAIAERLKVRRCRLEPIDLRVGVETDSTETERERELKILKVCLAEIERSRPFLLVLLGDRYGWVPGSDRIKAASGEAGFTPEDNDASVTALEIEYGLLKKDPVQLRRCLLCLREPLPYDLMPKAKASIYSDSYASDPNAPDRVKRLQELKAKIFSDPKLGSNRFPYRLDWDENIQHPKTDGNNGVKAWGQKVEAALWVLLDDETKQFAAQAEPTWQEQECFAIEELVERLNSSFVGREKIAEQALNLAMSLTAENTAWGLLFTGGTGTGKSALFAHINHSISKNKDILLLAHSAGVSPLASQTEWMLKRWISELGSVLGETPAISEDIKPDALEKLFAQILTRAASIRRVVVLVDALNQFVRTERARTVSWLPKIWPLNARFIATSIHGEETEHLAHRAGLSIVNVPPLNASESGAVAVQVYGRYHRQPNSDVLRELLSLRLPDGTAAAGNPLWLTLALDLLNQLDTDDFSDAEAVADGSPDEKLSAMVLERARSLPTDVEGLYGRLLSRVEKVAGTAETRAFASLIALSRNGWREEDLLHLLPRAADLFDASAITSLKPRTPHSWDPLRFAILRRCFCAHLVKRGKLDQWDFAHTTLRQAVNTKLMTEWQIGRTDDLARVLYSIGTDYLETLPRGTRLRENEIMWQMLGTRNASRVARYYSIATSESKMLALFLSEDETENSSHPLRQFVLSLLNVSDNDLRAYVANKFNFALNDALEIEGHLLLRKEILEATLRSLGCLAESDLTNVNWQRDLAVCQERIGNVLSAQGNLAGAIKAHRNSLAITQRLSEAEPSDEDWQRDISTSFIKIGDVLSTQGDLAGALKSFRDSLAITQRLAETDPSNTGLQRDLSLGQQRIGNILGDQGDLAGALKAHRNFLAITQRLAETDPSDANGQCDLAVCQERIGNILGDQGDLAGALKAFRNSLAIRERLVESDPTNVNWQREISVCQERIGNVLSAQGNLAGALKAHRESLAITQRLVEADPANAGWQRDLAVSQERTGDVLSDQGDLAGALKAHRDSLAIRERLVETDPSNAAWQRDLSFSFNKISNILRNQGDLAGALKAHRDSLAIVQRLAETDPSNAGWQRDLAVSQERIGNILSAQDNLAGAIKAHRNSLAIAQRLAETDPSNTGLQRDLSLGQERIGDVLSDQGDLAGALKAFRDSLAIRERLAETDPSNAVWQRDLSVSQERIGGVLSAQGDLAGALKAHGESLAIRERLAKSDPSNAGWQHDLSVSFNNIGNALNKQGDLAGALKAFRDALAIFQRLAETNPSDAGWQRDLWASYWNMAKVSEQTGNADALDWWRKTFDKLSEMKQRGILQPDDEQYLAITKQKLKPNPISRIINMITRHLG